MILSKNLSLSSEFSTLLLQSKGIKIPKNNYPLFQEKPHKAKLDTADYLLFERERVAGGGGVEDSHSRDTHCVGGREGIYIMFKD